MSDFPLHTIDSAPPEAKDALRGAEQQLGFIPNLFAVLAEAPATLEGYQTLTQILKKTSLSPAEQQVVLLSTAFSNQCDYCVPHYSALAEKAGAPQEVITAVREGRAIEDRKWQALRTFTQSITEKRGRIGQDEIESFRQAGFENRNVLEVLVGVAVATISNYTHHLAHHPLEEVMKAYAWTQPESAAAE